MKVNINKYGTYLIKRQIPQAKIIYVASLQYNNLPINNLYQMLKYNQILSAYRKMRLGLKNNSHKNIKNY